MATLTIQQVQYADPDYNFTVVLKSDTNERRRQWSITLPADKVDGKAPSEVLVSLWAKKADAMDQWVAQNEGAATMEGTGSAYGDVAIPKWDGSGVDYEVDDKVRYEGTVYEVLQAHTSQEDWTPPNSPSLLQESHDL